MSKWHSGLGNSSAERAIYPQGFDFNFRCLFFHFRFRFSFSDFRLREARCKRHCFRFKTLLSKKRTATKSRSPLVSWSHLGDLFLPLGASGPHFSCFFIIIPQKTYQHFWYQEISFIISECTHFTSLCWSRREVKYSQCNVGIMQTHC